jgi:hypothetical protein
MLLLLACSVEEVVAAYKALVAVYPSFTIEALQKILDARGQYNGFEKKHIKDVINQCRTVRTYGFTYQTVFATACSLGTAYSL